MGFIEWLGTAATSVFSFLRHMTKGILSGASALKNSSIGKGIKFVADHYQTVGRVANWTSGVLDRMDNAHQDLQRWERNLPPNNGRIRETPTYEAYDPRYDYDEEFYR
jgi:hypothetical protein